MSKFLKILSYVGGTLAAGVIIWGAASGWAIRDSRIENIDSRVKKIEKARKDSLILEKVREIKDEMVTKGEFHEAINGVKQQNRAENDYLIRHINDPLKNIQQDIKLFRKAWDADQELKKNSMSLRTQQSSESK